MELRTGPRSRARGVPEWEGGRGRTRGGRRRAPSSKRGPNTTGWLETETSHARVHGESRRPGTPAG
eukprot:4619581-Pyramimonas_sp.AAC.1